MLPHGKQRFDVECNSCCVQAVLRNVPNGTFRLYVYGTHDKEERGRETERQRQRQRQRERERPRCRYIEQPCLLFQGTDCSGNGTSSPNMFAEAKLDVVVGAASVFTMAVNGARSSNLDLLT